MAEYINRDALFKHYRALANIEWNKTVAPVSWSDAYEEIADHIAEMPAADVAPKSEVQRLYYNLQAVLEERAETKREIAREIFEEIERLLELNTLSGDIFIGKYFDADLENDIAELKKKYTEN